MLKFFVTVLLFGLISSDVVVMGCCGDCCKDKIKKLLFFRHSSESRGNSSIPEITNFVPETVDDIIPLIYDNEIDDNETVDDIIPLIYDNEIDDNETVDDNIPLIDDNEIGKFKGFSFDVITAKAKKIRSYPEIHVSNVYDSQENIKKTVVNFIKWFRANKNYADLKTRKLKFIDRSRIVEDSLGGMRHMFTQTKNSILSDERLFQSRVCGDTAYYDFVKGGEHYKEAYQLLGCMLGICLRTSWDNCPLFLNLNPLIYKIILNQCIIPEGLFNVNDLQYYARGAYNALATKPSALGNDCINGYMEEMYKYFRDQLPGIKIFYRSLCDFLNVDDFNILHYFGKSEFLRLKHYLEGVEIITYELLYDKLEIYNSTMNSGSNSDTKLYENLREKFTTIIKEYPPKKLRRLVFAITAVDTLFVEQPIRICFTHNLNMPLKASTCDRELRFDKDVFSPMSDHERQERMKNGLEELMASVDVLTVK